MLRFLRTHNIRVNPNTFALSVVISGFLGAKLDHAFLHPPTTFAGFFTSGYTCLGGVLAGALAAAVYIHRHRLPWLATFDALFCMAPGYALGRLGCFLAGDGDYGPPSTLPWAITFPHGLVPTLARVHPTMLYIAGWELLVFAALTRLDKRHPCPGTLLALYLIATGVGRFSLEFLSRNPVLAFHLTEAKCVSLALILAGLFTGTYFLINKQPGPTPFPLPPAASQAPFRT